MSFAYLLAIALSALGVGTLDARFKLALFRAPRRAVIAVTVTALLMLAIDLTAIATGNFLIGASPWMTGFEVLPHLPIEELFFVTFLAYVSLVAVTGAERTLTALRDRKERA